MAMSKSTNTYNRLNWEEADFPVLCQTCLGDNPYIRMTKDKFGKECKICSRPFTVFRWCPGARMRFKKTEICQTCCRLKNVCQTCLLDLEYGLPIQVRDAALKVQDKLPKSDVNREYFLQNADSQLEKSESPFTTGGGKSQAASDLLMKLARTTPYYKRNRPHICSFWVKGQCKRGEECPYRHEKPTDPDDPLSDQNIKDRYYGTDDPVADKLLRRASALPQLEAPEDRSITTLYIGNLGEKITEKDLKDHFYQYGEIRNISLVKGQSCGFIQYTTRAAAEVAAEKTFNKLVINGRRLVVKWGKSQGQIASMDAEKMNAEQKAGTSQPVPGLPQTLPVPSEELQQNFFNLGEQVTAPIGGPVPFFYSPGGSFTPQEPPVPGVGPLPPGVQPLQQRAFYPSQDPTRMGSFEKPF